MLGPKNLNYARVTKSNDPKTNVIALFMVLYQESVLVDLMDDLVLM